MSPKTIVCPKNSLERDVRKGERAEKMDLQVCRVVTFWKTFLMTLRYSCCIVPLQLHIWQIVVVLVPEVWVISPIWPHGVMAKLHGVTLCGKIKQKLSPWDYSGLKSIYVQFIRST